VLLLALVPVTAASPAEAGFPLASAAGAAADCPLDGVLLPGLGLALSDGDGDGEGDVLPLGLVAGELG